MPGWTKYTLKPRREAYSIQNTMAQRSKQGSEWTGNGSMWQNLYQKRTEREDGCDLTDYRKVMGNGVALAFEKALNDPEGNVLQVEVTFSDSDNTHSGTGGKNSRQVVAPVTVKVKNGKFAVRKGIKKMMENYHDFQSVFRQEPKFKGKKGNHYTYWFLYKTRFIFI